MGNTLKRSEYWDHDLYIPRIGATGSAQSHTDMHRYLLPMDQARNTACLTWGVAAGMTVRAAAGGSGGVRVSPGAAIDVEGRLIVLRPGGAAVVDPAADPDQIDDIMTVLVADDGVALGTAEVNGDRLLTVTWLEVLQREDPDDPPQLVHAPWFRLIPVEDDDGRQVVLAQLTLDDGRVTASSAGLRRLVGVPTGRLELRAATDSGGAGLKVGQRVMAEFAADSKGDVALTLTSTDGHRRSLSVDGATGDVSVHSTLRARGDADIAGKLTARAAVEITGSMNVHGVLNVLNTLKVHNVLDALGALNVHGALTAKGSVTANAGLTVNGVLDAGRRMRVRQGEDVTSGIWFHQRVPNADRAFIGMVDDTTVGILGNTGAGWALRINTTTGETTFPGSKVAIAGKLDVTGTLTTQNTIDAQGVLNARNVLNALGALNVHGALTAKGSVTANAGLTVNGVLDAGRRMRVRQGTDVTAGIWFNDNASDRVFIGMMNDNQVGVYCSPLVDWPLFFIIDTGEAWFTRGMLVRGPEAQFECGRVDIHAPVYIGGDASIHGDKVYVHNKLRVVGQSSLEGGTKIYGSLTKPGGTFLIDHPLDPTGKYLAHSFVESPEMLNVYSGVAVTDDRGEVTVTLPDFFEALNRDHRFQVTPVGRLALAAVDGEVRNNAFTIRTDQPNVTVSWQVTGVRQDPWALAHPVEVESDKPEEERGLLLYPEEHGYPATMRITDPPEAERERKPT
ncbi:hypothetical protein [Nonomuraea sp. NPDC048826]|uniref:hypothetical protein n=1 Tax=Nonomuraea sp. NPDC048826 TaxID=3364347 RepID=UPI0037182220